MKKCNVQNISVKGLIGACGLLIAFLAVAEPIVESRNVHHSQNPSTSSASSYSNSSHRSQSNAQLSLPQIEALEQEIRNLRGQLEVQEHEIKRLSKSQQDFYLDLERKLQKGTVTSTASANPTPRSDAVSSVVNAKPIPLAPKPAPKAGITATRTLPAAPRPLAHKTATPTPARVIYEPIDTEAGEEVISSEPIPETDELSAQLPISGLPAEKVLTQESSEPVKGATAKTPTDPLKPTLVIKGTVVEKNTYENAYNLVLNKRYPEAVTALKDFLTQYPKGQYAPNAHYWLGEVYTLQARSTKNSDLLDKASTEFLAITTNFPNHQKAMDALLKLGIIEGDKGNKELAREYLTNVKERYPGTSVARIASTHLQRLK
jgi:tol-pal system protein YbgF